MGVKAGIPGAYIMDYESESDFIIGKLTKRIEMMSTKLETSRKDTSI